MAFQLDRAGGAEVLKMIASEEVAALAAQVAATAGQDASVSTKVSKTRFVATVKVPASAQAKDGVLSRAAASLGLQINAYPKRAPRKRSADQTGRPARKRGRPRKQPK